VNKVKVLLKCVYGDKKPGEQVELDEKTANYYASMGWMKVLETVKEPEPKKASKKK
jgi:hypothetical protein